MLHKLAIDCGNARVVPVRHRQVEEARNLVEHVRSSWYVQFKRSSLSHSKFQNLVEMFDSVGETCPVPMGCGFEGEEHIKLVRTPVL